jgi:hypothetical protein
MSDQKRLGEFMPIPETEGKPFQVDRYGNHRIVMKGKESIWFKKYELATLKVNNKDGSTDRFFAITDMYYGVLPTMCVLKAVVVDEDGDSDYFQFKIVDLMKNEILEDCGVFNALQASTFEQDYCISVKMSKRDDFIKIKVVEHNSLGCSNLDKVLDKDGVTNYLVDALDRHEFDIYDSDHVLINDCAGCDICLENRCLKEPPLL